MSIQRRKPRKNVAVVGIIGQGRRLCAAETDAAAVGETPGDDALQFTVMPGKPCDHFVQRRVMRIGDPAQRRRKGALLDSHGASQIDKRPSLHFQQGALLPVIVYIFIVYRRYLKRRFTSFRRENQRHAATPQPGIGPDVVGQSGKLFRRLAPRKHGYRLTAAPQQGGNAGVMRPEIAVGVVAAGGDHGVDGRRSVVQADRRGRVDFAQQPHDMFHQHGILGGGLHETTVAAHKHAQQVEKTDERNVPGHDHPNTPRPGELQRASLPQQRGFKMDNRQLIMNSALTLFYESGYDAVGVQQIVDSAGVSKPTLYYYFGSKQGLLEALLNEHFQPMEQKLIEASETGKNIPEKLYRIARAFFNGASEDPKFHMLMMALFYSGRKSEGFRTVYPMIDRFYHLCVDVFDNASAELGNMNGRQEQFAVGFSGILMHYLMMTAGDQSDLSNLVVRDEEVYRLVHQFMYGIYS